jgi:glycosyltransferase involved in cell wall biosynthesis
VLPSHQENFGISVVEALACGTPVLISNKVNIWREIQAADAGFVEPDDVDGAILLLKRWAATSPSQKLQMRTNAKLCFDANFDICVTSGRLFKILLTGSGRQPSELSA